jgi:hypothetical protein
MNSSCSRNALNQAFTNTVTWPRIAESRFIHQVDGSLNTVWSGQYPGDCKAVLWRYWREREPEAAEGIDEKKLLTNTITLCFS